MMPKISLLLLFPALALSMTTLHAEDVNNPIGRFEITRFEVEGNTLFAQPMVDWMLEPFVGKQRDFGDVQRALEKLENAYHEQGYNLVQVRLPEQELNQGVVHLQVIETRLGKVTIEGNRVFDQENIRASLPGLRSGETPNLPAVSRSLKVANENPAKKATLQLQSGDKDGEVDAVVNIVDEKVWSGTVSVDNTGDSNTGRNRLNAQIQHANVGGKDQVLSLQYTTSIEHPSQVSVYAVGYHVPLYALGDSLDFFASYSDVDSGTVSAGLFDLLVSGKGSVFGGRYNHNFTKIGEYDSKLIGGIDEKAFKNNVSLQGAQLGNDVTVHPLSVTYNGNWTLSGGEANFYLGGVRNIAGGSRGSQADFDRVRSGASANYSMLRYGASYSRVFATDWQLRLNLSGQSSADALVPGEQFGAGGASTVRGFQEREVAGDSGRVANLEVYAPNLCNGMKTTAAQCRLLGFYDHGYVARNNPLPGEQAQASIGSMGMGLRMSMDKYLALQMDYGRVVDAADTRAKGEQRVHFRMALSY